MARFRDLNVREQKQQLKRLKVTEKTHQMVTFNTGPETRASFMFDRIFHEEETNHDIYDYLKPLIDIVHTDKVNVLLIFDSHTGAGKTYTMFNGMDAVVERCAKQVLAFGESSLASEDRPEVRFASREDHIEVNKDLLRDVKTGAPADESADGHKVESLEALMTLFNAAKAKRTHRRMPQNDESSRSHAVHTLSLNWQKSVKASIKFLDLAGNEDTPDEKYFHIKKRKDFGDANREHNHIKSSRASFQGTIVAHAAGGQKNKVCTTLSHNLLERIARRLTCV